MKSDIKSQSSQGKKKLNSSLKQQNLTEPCPLSLTFPAAVAQWSCAPQTHPIPNLGRQYSSLQESTRNAQG